MVRSYVVTSAINQMPFSHVTEEQMKEVTQRQIEALPLSIEDRSENAHFHDSKKKYKIHMRLQETQSFVQYYG